jgi:imidazolonepropionase-like amidohydrolase
MTFSLRSRLAAACVGLVLLTALLSGHTVAAPRTAPFPGLRETTPSSHAIVGGKIVVSPKQSIDNGVIVIRDGVIVAVGPKDQIKIPGDAQIWNAEGKTVYPGLIDAFSELSGEAPRGGGPRGSGGESASGGAAYWNPNVTPQVRAHLAYASDAAANRKLRSQGITSRLVAPTAGIVKGTSVLVNTADEAGKQSILKDQVALHLKLTTSRGGGGYPNSPMGAYTLVRQAFYDAGWYGQAWDAHQQGKDVPRPERSDALAVMRGYLGGKLPVIIDASDELYFLRADRIGDEFGLDVIVNGSGEEYRRLAEVKETGRAVIVPLNFPKAPNVATQEAAANVTLERLMHWDLAPENPARLAEAGVRISFTTAGLKDAAGFLAAVRKAVKRGLTSEAALTALTTTPAQLFGLADRLGTIEVGKAANVVVASGELFNDKTKVLETWVDGQRFEIEPEAPLDVRGVWNVKTTTADGKEETLKIELTGQPSKLAGKVVHGEPNTPLISPALLDMQFTTSFKGKPIGFDGVIQLSATVSQEAGDAAAGAKPKLTWIGVIAWADGRKTPSTAEWAEAPKPADKPAEKPSDNPADKPAEKADGAKAEKPKDKPARPAENQADDKPPKKEEDKPQEKAKEGDKPDGEKPKDDKEKADAAKEKEKEDAKPIRALSKVNFPLGDFGRATPFPDQPNAVLFRNATVWTSGPAGRLEGADVLVEKGKIKAVGRGLTAPDGAILIDATGKHISPGIIDCHSHAATDGGINESGQTITAEVRVGDFVDPNDINIYRQVAGGVTSSNILHGSANTIGGQNQVLKFRWGAGPEEMKFAAAPQGIKFALGENVKQSNWGAGASNRYPQSRMGVEQLVRDEFKAAQAYRDGWDNWNRTKVGLPPRVDLELQAVAEILDGKRLIHCHSYRQDEILALLRTCEDYKVKIATLQHILEGYKVADVMAQQGIGGSSFSDWWIYKYEVVDAIPYNGALMHNAGVVVSFNSDDAELARRLNLEAAKAVKYGGVSPEEALKFVTLNPAKQLRIDPYVGSLEPGKDADLVIWSTSPLSAYTRCEQTWIDGRRYFDREEDRKQRDEMTTLRAALIQRILGSGDATEGPDEGRKEQWPREDLFCHGHDHGDHNH